MLGNPEFLLIIFLIYLLAGLVKGVMGFGLPIITMSLLPFFVSIETAIVLSAIVQPATNVFQFYLAKHWSEAFTLAKPVLIALVPGVVLGAWLLSLVSSSVLLVLAGMTITLHSLYQLKGARFIIPRDRQSNAGYWFGFVAGIVGALTSLNGWAFVIYLIACEVSRNLFRSTIALLFLVSGTLISGSFWLTGLLTTELLLIGLLMLVPAFVGMWLGERIGSRLSNDAFRKLVLSSLVIIGGVIVYRGLQ
ncbi:MAG: sulfite exporter TauE/SafE family protein [Rhizobiaceae bacterium]|nr:sulfite exporter TauE/SafE family protein [Rhizobiaceae bacterium]